MHATCQDSGTMTCAATMTAGAPTSTSGMTLPAKRSLAVNVVNTFSSSESHNRLWLKMPEQYSSMDYDILNNIDNRYYSIIAQADYTTPLWKGELNTGAYFNYKELRQAYNGGPESYLNMRQHYVYIAYTGRYKRLSYYASLGANAVAQHPVSGQSFVNVIPYSSLTLFYRFTRTFSTRLIAKLKGTRPTTGDLAENRVNIDSRFIATGNPALKPYRTFSLTFKPQYSTSDGRLSLSPSIEYLYSHHPNVPCLLSDGDNIVMMPMRIDARNELNGTMIVNYSPCNWMMLQSSLPVLPRRILNAKLNYTAQLSPHRRHGGDVLSPLAVHHIRQLARQVI